MVLKNVCFSCWIIKGTFICSDARLVSFTASRRFTNRTKASISFSSKILYFVIEHQLRVIFQVVVVFTGTHISMGNDIEVAFLHRDRCRPEFVKETSAA